MPEETKSAMQCIEFEALLFEAVEGTLEATRLNQFEAHASVCPACGPLFAEADAGRRWLKGLAEVEPPKYLVHNILIATSGVEERSVKVAPAPRTNVLGWLRDARSAIWASMRQPRFGMSMAMAFFSISLAMNVAGVRVSDVARMDLRPSALSRSYYATQGRVVKYYSNIRLVYEFQSSLRDLKRATTPAEPGPTEEQKRKDREKGGDTSRKSDQQREHKQQNYYSQEEPRYLLAGCSDQSVAGRSMA